MKIRQYIIAALLLFCVSFIGGCIGMDVHTSKAEAAQPEQIRFMYIENAGNGMHIYKDTVTGVHYAVYEKTESSRTYGGYYVNNKTAAMCVLVNADGKPLL